MREVDRPTTRNPDQPATEPDLGFDRTDLADLLVRRMPFGRFRGRALIDLPEEYLLWFECHGFPTGTLGRQMRLALGIKRYGGEKVLKDYRALFPADGDGDPPGGRSLSGERAPHG